MNTFAPSLVPVQNLAPYSGAVFLLQRECSCGGSHADETEQCDECKKGSIQTRLEVSTPGDPFEQEADEAADQVMRATPAAGLSHRRPVQIQRSVNGSSSRASVPPSISRVIGAPGQPLDSASRSRLEPAFGYDFGRVRVHADAPAAQSARSVAAHAYTIGNHVVFGAGRYSPGSEKGLKLLAHELAHVVQQRAAIQRSSISDSAKVVDDDDEELQARASEDEGHGGLSAAPGLKIQRQADTTPAATAPSPGTTTSTPPAETPEQICIRTAGPDPSECDPSRSLTWADFTGAVPAASIYDALTYSEIIDRPINVAARRCTPTAPGVAALPTTSLQAHFVPANSWVKPAPAQPANSAVNGCAGRITQCEQHFDAQAALNHTNVTWALSTAAPANCAAGERNRGDVAHSRADCTTIVGTDCADRSAAESARLLRHEQGHFDIACELAKKANAMITPATNLTNLRTAANTKNSTVQARYDTQTRHGCIAAQQSSWETAIAGGLPAITITLTTPRRRRRR